MNEYFLVNESIEGRPLGLEVLKKEEDAQKRCDELSQAGKAGAEYFVSALFGQDLVPWVMSGHLPESVLDEDTP